MKYIIPAEKDVSNFKTVTESCDILSARTQQQFNPRNISRQLSKHDFIKDRKRVKGRNSALSGFYVTEDVKSLDDLREQLSRT